ncbi:hypothetical protein RB597_001221 [Gaeumannomyces tritici]
MKPNFASWALLAAQVAAAAAASSLLSFGDGDSPYRLAAQGVAPVIKVSGDDWPAVLRTARDLAADFGRVVGANGTVSLVANGTATISRPCRDRPVIVAGTIGRSSLIDALIGAGKLDVAKTKGAWESYTSQVVRDVAPGVPWALVVAGSDRRGTVYGLYDISETMGVSPWYWWADVPVKTKTAVYVKPEGKVQKEPSVKYRGFFINDEHPALLGWVNENFGGVWGSEFYAHVFELCLRLKGNYLWPAMWGKMFYLNDTKSGPLAEEYGVVMGTSHHEPMARSEREQQLYNNGAWDWSRNKANITKFFREGVERSRDWETYYTMGMRGSGDEASPTLTAPALEEIIGVQQKILSEVFNTTDMLSIPQTWVLYKEVSEYYKAGLKVPESVMLLWTDDNSGNLIRVPIANETGLVAGAGVYYHFDYVGAPRSYKWINTIQLVKTWEQMHLAYAKNARHLWLANVGDLKPLEIPLTQFMDMAYDMDRHTGPDATTAWLKRWATSEFGASAADATAAILNEYGVLLGRRKYELLSDEPFSTTNYDEAERNLARWGALLELTQRTYDSLDAATKIAYFQLILHPVMAGKTVVDLYTKTWLNKVAAGQGRVSANTLAAQASVLFTRDAEITNMYHSHNGGKWNHFVDQVHIGYTSWNDPPANIMPKMSYTGPANAPGAGSLGVAFEGSTTALHDGASARILSVDPNLPPADVRWLEIFARKNGTFPYTITSNASFVTVSNAEGTITAPGDGSDVRSVVSVDWDAAPEGETSVTLSVRDGGGAVVATAVLPVVKTSVPAGFSGFVESNGVVAMEAAHFASAESKGGLSYVEIPHYGRTLSGVKTMPATSGSQTAATGPALKYSLYATKGSASAARLVVYLGASHNHDPTRPLRFAYSFDGAAPAEVKPVPDVPIYREGPEWRSAVVGGGWISTVTIPGGLGKGAHELSLWLLEPGVVVQKIAVDFGGLRPSSFGPHESKKV